MTARSRGRPFGQLPRRDACDGWCMEGPTGLDNCLARADDAVDWLIWNDEVAKVLASSWSRCDTMLMGRRTYEVAAARGQGGGYPGVATCVCSRTMTASPADGVTLVRDEMAGFVRGLKAAAGTSRELQAGPKAGFIVDTWSLVGGSTPV